MRGHTYLYQYKDLKTYVCNKVIYTRIDKEGVYSPSHDHYT